ncbi:protein MMS22-like [Bradysia coprophila]|uniref:protein MMS22-like n=1 Tax=Bradysia coprophila TaxID=38358 RepID=UPI00187D814A|nr:protein MMS22-like [Bradysia coprophila]
MLDDDDFLDDLLMETIDNIDNVASKPTNLCFNCRGECDGNQLPNDGFVKSMDTQFLSHEHHICIFEVFDIKISDSTLSNSYVLTRFMNKARMSIQTLIVASRTNLKENRKPFLDIRLQVTQFLIKIRNLVGADRLDGDTVRTGLRSLENLLNNHLSLPHINFISPPSHRSGTLYTSSLHHLFHGHLEWRWLCLTINLRILQNEIMEFNSLRDTEFERQLCSLIRDLMLLSSRKYNKHKSSELIIQSPFECMCVKELWLLLQLLVEQLHNHDRVDPFWMYFNKCLNQLNDGSKIISERSVQPKDDIEFSAWLLNGVSTLYGYSDSGTFVGSSSLRSADNYELLEGLTRKFLNSDPAEELLRMFMCLTIPLMYEWWSPKTDIVMLYWEFFHKKLNSSFFIPGSAPSNLAIMNSSISKYLDDVRSRLSNDAVGLGDTSFFMFLYLLGKIGAKLEIEGSQMKKILGRISSKFSTAKLMALNETGIHNVVSLFLTLSMTVDMGEMGPRIQNILLQIPLVKVTQPRQVALTRGYISLLIVFIQKNMEVHIFISKILENITSLRLDAGYVSTLRILADGLNVIYSQCENFILGEHLLLDSWLVKYLSICSFSEREILLGRLDETFVRAATLLSTVDNSAQRQNCVKFIETTNKHILPYIQQAFTESYEGDVIPKFAANLCLFNRFGVKELNHELFKSFVETQKTDIQNLLSFLVLILSSDNCDDVPQSLIIKNWIRCNFCSTNYNQDLKTLTNIVSTLKEFQEVCDTDVAELLESDEPLLVFFSEVGKCFCNATDIRKRFNIMEKMNVFMSSIEKYVGLTDNILKSYSMIGVIMIHCSQILYVKGKSNCLFNVIMYTHILSNSFLTGTAPTKDVTQAVHKIWHSLIVGIEKLDYKTDANISSMLTHLIVKWLPHFAKMTPNNVQMNAKPYISCLRDCSEAISQIVFDKINLNFLSLKRRQPNEHALFVIAMLKEAFIKFSDDGRKLELIVRSTFATLVDHAMMIEMPNGPTSRQIFELFELIFSCPSYNTPTSVIRETVTTVLKSCTSNNLSFYSSFYFQFVTKLVNINPILVEANMPHLRDQIASVEKLRGVGRDGKLRGDLDNLEQVLAVVKFEKSDM